MFIGQVVVRSEAIAATISARLNDSAVAADGLTIYPTAFGTNEE